jgi:Sulfotransferase family
MAETPHAISIANEILGSAAVDEAYRVDAAEALAVLTQAVFDDPDLPETAKEDALQRFRGDVAKVAALQHDRRTIPGIADQEIVAPLFILGLPRCGTSILQSLMGSVPDARTLLQWELTYFSPPPEPADPDDPRLTQLNAAIDAGAGEIKKMHPIGAIQAQECGPFLEMAFRSSMFCMDLRVEPYLEWYLTADSTSAYQMHKAWLQHFQSTQPGPRWVCKIQEHMYHVPELLGVYPDAMLVQPHRDPVAVIASISSLIGTLRQRTFGEVDAATLGREMIHLWGSGLDKFMAFRRANPEVRVCDVAFRDIVADPVGAVGRIHEFFDLPYPQASADAVAAWWTANPPHKDGKHVYSLGDWGLTENEVLEAFDDYRSEYAEFV